MKKNNQEKFEVRKACMEDIDKLVDVSRTCFKDFFVCQGTRKATLKWWQFFLSSTYCETWIWMVNGTTQGFVTLVLDTDQYSRMKYTPGLIDIFVAAIRNPSLVKSKLVRKFSSFKPTKVVVSQKEDCSADKTLWLELIAVLPESRRKKVATNILRFCTRRAGELGCNIVKLYVEKYNLGAIGMYEEFGFAVTSEAKHSLIYTKTVA